MLDQMARPERDGDFVQFWQTGADAQGSYHCTDCGYGVSVQSTLPTCPMCAGTAWELGPTSPFASGDLPL